MKGRERGRSGGKEGERERERKNKDLDGPPQEGLSEEMTYQLESKVRGSQVKTNGKDIPGRKTSVREGSGWRGGVSQRTKEGHCGPCKQKPEKHKAGAQAGTKTRQDNIQENFTSLMHHEKNG